MTTLVMLASCGVEFSLYSHRYDPFGASQFCCLRKQLDEPDDSHDLFCLLSTGVYSSLALDPVSYSWFAKGR